MNDEESLIHNNRSYIDDPHDDSRGILCRDPEQFMNELAESQNKLRAEVRFQDLYTLETCL